MYKGFVAFAIGVMFAVGLVISGMTNPAKVLAFLNISGKWDPSLAFVMIGAIGVFSISYQFVIKRNSPILEETFCVPTKKSIDKKLIIGALLFGIGWGISGVCPGPAIVNLNLFNQSTLIFFAAMVGGAFIFQMIHVREKNV